MGLNDVALPASLIADLYKDHLIESNGQAEPVAAPNKKGAKKNIQYLGKNQKGVCLLVDYANDVYLPDEQLHFLTTILQACKLNLGDVAIINCHKQKIAFDELKEQLSCSYLLLFGVKALSIGLNEISLFTSHNIGNCNIVCSPAAEQLNNSDAESKLLKSKLWLCLKQLFIV